MPKVINVLNVERQIERETDRERTKDAQVHFKIITTARHANSHPLCRERERKREREREREKERERECVCV